MARNSCGSRRASQKSSPAQPALAPHAYKWVGFPPQAAAPSFVFSVFSHQAQPPEAPAAPTAGTAHATEPLSTRARCVHVSAHTDTYTCLVLTPQPLPNRIPASPQHTPSSVTPGSEVGRREGLLPVSDPLQLAGLGGRERWREGQRVSIWDEPLRQQEGRGSSDRRAQVSCQGRGGQEWPP